MRRSLLLVAVALGALVTSNAWAEPARAQLVGYAGQVSTSITGQYPVGFRFFDGKGAPVYEETVTANVQQGRIQVYVGSRRGDMTDVLRASRRMEVSFQGRRLESLPVIHTTRSELVDTVNDSSPMRAVWFAEGESTSEIEPEGLCRLVRSGFFTIPFTNTTVGVGTPSCNPGERAVSGGYNMVITPSQGVIVFGVFAYFANSWQINYEVRSTPATMELMTICCPWAL
ncbi:MAG TPA: hypothetical protein VNM90_29330 [Haliangium sp.]|nr:hypothetical protein [Haliangium sp.]